MATGVRECEGKKGVVGVLCIWSCLVGDRAMFGTARRDVLSVWYANRGDWHLISVPGHYLALQEHV